MSLSAARSPGGEPTRSAIYDNAAKRRLIALALGSRVLSVAAALAIAFAVTPDAFGIYGQVQAIGLVYAVIALLRYERVVVVAAPVREALCATRIGVVALAVSAPVGALLGWLGIPAVQSALVPPSGIVLLCALLAGRGLVLLAHSWLLRASRQGDISKLIALQAAVQFVAQTGLLIAGADPVVALLAGDAIGSGAALFRCHGMDPRVSRLARVAGPGLRVMNRWRTLPLVNLPAALMSQALVSLPLLGWGRLATADATGHMALAMRVADAPMQLIAATATSLAVTARLWTAGNRSADISRSAAAYVAIIATMFAMLLVAGWLATLLDANERVSAAAGHLPLAAALAAAVALGAPHADLVTFAGRERLALTIHGVALASGVIVVAVSGNPATMLVLFAVILLLRSAALWMALPRRRRGSP